MIKHLVRANMAQSVEHHLGKVEVTGSIPVISSKMIAFAIFFYCYIITNIASKFGRFCIFSNLLFFYINNFLVSKMVSKWCQV